MSGSSVPVMPSFGRRRRGGQLSGQAARWGFVLATMV
jgi:hypothetical protein